MSVNHQSHSSDVVIRYIDANLVPTPQQTETWLSWFDAREHERMRRFLKPQHRQRFLLSHALLRGALAEFVQCQPAALGFAAMPHGKPILETPSAASAVHFNLTHTHGMAALAISLRPVGLDIEWLQRRGPEVALAERYFTHTEYQDILAQPQTQQHRRLLSYWTLKESYIKAEGWGLSIGLDSFEFEIPQDRSPQLRVLAPQAQSQHPWQFQQFVLEQSHLMAIAAVPALRQHTALRIDCAAWRP